MSQLFPLRPVESLRLLHFAYFYFGKKNNPPLLFLLQPRDQAGNYVSRGCGRAVEGTEDGEEDVSRKGGEQRAWAR